MDITSNPSSRNRHSGTIVRGICVFLAFALTIAAPAEISAADLGRLFLTPQQRLDLDRRRATNRAEEEAPQIKEGPLTLEGHVQRSGGKTATWINGSPQYDSHKSRDPAEVTVVPNAGEAGVKLRVGEIYDRTSGEVRDSLGDGKITIGKPSSKMPPKTRRGGDGRLPAPEH